MKESLQEEIIANTELQDDATLSEQVKKFVKQNTNKVYEPVVFTSEVAEEFGVSAEEAREALRESAYIEEKEVGEISVWW